MNPKQHYATAMNPFLNGTKNYGIGGTCKRSLKSGAHSEQVKDAKKSARCNRLCALTPNSLERRVARSWRFGCHRDRAL